jgi:hypothetical protein
MVIGYIFLGYRLLAEQSDFPSAAHHCEASLALLQQRYGTASVSAEMGREQLKCATLHFAVRFFYIIYTFEFAPGECVRAQGLISCSYMYGKQGGVLAY